ncbi:hypothetical protein TNCV_4767351 [Trichonephila clavipes]|nr:hypothetical protein TNCV_4767351 [Trichonephila clavipes]
MKRTGFQMLNDGEIVTCVQEETNPVDDETDEDEDNDNESSKGPLNDDAFSALETRDRNGVVRTTIRMLSCSTTATQENQGPCNEKRHGTEGEGNILQSPALEDSAHKTFVPTVLTSTYSECTQRVFGGIEPRPSGQDSDALTTRLPMALSRKLNPMNSSPDII